jgi:hypothetical protein
VVPNRIVKETIRTSDTLASVSADAERLFWRLVASADDFGRYDARLNTILGQCLTPFIGKYSLGQVQEWLIELQDAELIRLYEVEGQPFLELTKWDKHQRPRAKTSKFPPYDAENSNPLTFDSKCCQTKTNVAPNVFENGNGNENDKKTGGERAREIEETRTIVRSFEKHYGRDINPTFAGDLHAFVTKGMDVTLVDNALHIARSKEKPPDYALGILSRQFDRGIRTAQQAEQVEREYVAQKANRSGRAIDRTEQALEDYARMAGLTDESPRSVVHIQNSYRRLSSADHKAGDG